MLPADTEDGSASFSTESEQSVIGGLLLDNEAWDRIADKVAERDFYSLDHRKIFRAIARLLEANKPADVITVGEFLEDHQELDKVGGMPYLVQLVETTPSAANIARYAEIVRERSLRRSLAKAAMEIQEKVAHPSGMTAREMLDFAQGRVMALSETAAKGQGGPQHVGPVIDAVLLYIDELSRCKQTSDVTGLSSSFMELDRMTTGMQPGDLVIVAARPSMGKTAFSLNVAEHVAMKEGKNVAFFSLEMANNQLGVRLLASVSRLNQQRVKIGRLNEGEWKRLWDAASGLREAAIHLDEEGSLTVNELRARARRLHRECGGLGLIVVDYLQLMEGGGRTDNRAVEIAEISRGLKKLAKELYVPVMALSQLNRSLESRPNKRPIMSDLRDSGGIEQDADLILFIYRDEVYNEETPDRGIAELIIGKQRNGPTGTVYVSFIGEQTRFEDRPKNAPVPSMQERVAKRERRALSGRSFPRSLGGGDGVPI